jgi:preprotein translocase SecE subunit
VARDRKRAKQRRDRRERRGAGTASTPTDPAPGERPLAADGEGNLGDDSTLQAPEPLEHASAEVDIAEAQLAVGRPDLADAGSAEDAELADEQAAPPPVRRPAEHEGNRVVAFARGSWRELQRVQWPDRRQVAQATGVVLGFVVIAGAFLGLADLLAGKLVDAIL